MLYYVRFVGLFTNLDCLVWDYDIIAVETSHLPKVRSPADRTRTHTIKTISIVTQSAYAHSTQRFELVSDKCLVSYARYDFPNCHYGRESVYLQIYTVRSAGIRVYAANLPETTERGPTTPKQVRHG